METAIKIADVKYKDDIIVENCTINNAYDDSDLPSVVVKNCISYHCTEFSGTHKNRETEIKNPIFTNSFGLSIKTVK